MLLSDVGLFDMGWFRFFEAVEETTTDVGEYNICFERSCAPACFSDPPGGVANIPWLPKICGYRAGVEVVRFQRAVLVHMAERASCFRVETYVPSPKRLAAIPTPFPPNS